MKKARVTVPPAAAILAGGVFFTGPASAAIIFSENFEGVNAFGMPTYTYAQDYTLPNAAGGLVYGHGGAGPNGTGNAGTNTFQGGNVSLTAAVSAAQIDAGLGAFDFRGDFSTWTMQGDWAELSVTFKDALDAPIGSPVLIGGMAFTAALAAGPNSKYTDAREWGTDIRTGTIPAGARSVDIVVTSTKTPDGLNTDGYVDNISLDASAIPGPATVALAGLAGLALLRRRR
jgi:uncharacterized protein (TIGR03382 family)